MTDDERRFFADMLACMEDVTSLAVPGVDHESGRDRGLVRDSIEKLRLRLEDL